MKFSNAKLFIFAKRHTVKIRTSALGAYSIFEVFISVLIQGGRLLGAGRIMIFFNTCNETNQKKVIMIFYFFLKTSN